MWALDLAWLVSLLEEGNAGIDTWGKGHVKTEAETNEQSTSQGRPAAASHHQELGEKHRNRFSFRILPPQGTKPVDFGHLASSSMRE